ncbi:type VII secretion target [Nocardia sp. NBC_01377]|uniref:type VII secretion target n=1 Tax=Nocardia sp. NBC_01377 TaxID=2903595 RepID=UPI0032493207
MSDLVAAPDAIRGYAEAAVSMATGVATAGTVDQAATMAAVVPVFGLIGQEFLFAFAHAQANHVSSVLELAAVHAATAMTATQSAIAYETSEATSAAEFDTAAYGLP